MPAMNPEQFLWISLGADPDEQRLVFEYLDIITVKRADRIICNTSYELEGPLLAGHRFGKSSGHLWPVDTGCLTCLAEQPNQSVIYVAFDSFTIFDQKQFQLFKNWL